MDVDGIGLECLNEKLKPICGLEFDSEQSAYDFYNAYGRSMGFSVRKDTFGKNKHTGELTSRIFVCCKEGFRANDKRDVLTVKPRVETRIGCSAHLSIKLDREKNIFFVNRFVDEHNHPLVMPECAHMLPSQRTLSASQAIEVDLAEQSRIPLKSSYELLGRQVGGRESLGYTKRDQKNYLRSKRQNKFAYGDAGCLLKYFSNQTLNNPSFFYAMQLDSEEQITNIFWADARMIMDYGHFGDVVSFDTTYKTNKENRPFGVFVGLNHHRETVVFGAALMYDETVDSFIWLFETFLQAMSEKLPKTILTDQDAAMAKAISHVMPNTYHRLCTWHMMQNALKHVNGVFRGPGGVKSILSKFIDEIDEENQFLIVWNEMLEKYNAQNNNWLKSIFNIREKWAYAYVRHAWSAGMKSTQLSESFNANLKDYLKSDLNVAQFFMHFERVINDKRYKELEAEYDSCYWLANLKISCKMLIQAKEVYTKAIFKEFQDQFEEAVDLNLSSCVVDDESFFYIITDDHSREWQIKKKDNLLSCTCRMFEMKGFLCCHVIKVFRESMNIKEIPTEYILKRWTKQARGETVQDINGREIQADPKLRQTFRYRSLCSIFTRISSRVSENEKAYNLANAYASSLAKQVEDLLRLEIDGNIHEKDIEDQDVDVEVECTQDSNFVKAKGLKKKETSRGRRRFKSGLEKALAKKKKSSNLLPHSQSSTATIQLLPVVGRNLHSSMVYNSFTPNVQIQNDNVPNLKPWTPLEQSEHQSFQELLRQSGANFSFAFQDSQASTSSTLI